MAETRIEPIRLEDGRRGERRVTEEIDYETCHGEKVIEQLEEDPRPLHLKQRVREKTKPCVYERIIETINGDEIVERKVESLESNVPLQLREHIGLVNNKVSTQSSDCISKEELQQHLDELKASLRQRDNVTREELEGYLSNTKDELEQRLVSLKREPKTIRAQQAVEEEVESSESWTWIEWILLAVVGAEAAYLVTNILPQYLNRF